jgi:Raf kinase inhibitor-like YbhB/YbcL family protein
MRVGMKVHTQRYIIPEFAMLICVAGAAGLLARPSGGAAVSLELASPDFTPGGNIPKQFTCEGANISPALKWNDPPGAAQSFVLIADDPDAPVGTWVHWVIFNLPASLRAIPQNFPKNEQSADGSRQGRNDFGEIGYGGPCPPPGKPHRYFFKLYAVDGKLKLAPGATKAQVERAIEGHILAQGEYIGRFSR